MDLTPKQQTSEAIRQADSILILTGQHPSVDQTVSVMALAMILRKYGKQVSAVISDTLPNATNMLDQSVLDKSLGGARDFILKVDVAKAEVDKLRYEMTDGKLNVIITPYKGNFAPSDVTFDYGESQAHYDLIIVLGVPNRARIDQVYEQNAAVFDQIPLINLDFHRTNENYGAVNLIDPNASSLCEILVALSESLQGGIIDADIATPLLMGLVASTDRFTATHTTSKSLTVAAQMMAAGAKQQAVVRALYRDGRGGNDRSDRGERNDRNDRNDRGNNSNASGRNETRRESAPARSVEPRREPMAEVRREPVEPRREQPAPMAAAAPTPAPVPAPAEPVAPVRAAEIEPEPELPIIAPSHIEMMAPVEAAPAPAPAAMPGSSTAAQPIAEPVVPQPQPVVAPGQLPPEMSPLVDMSTQNLVVHPDQASLDMPMPSAVRNDA